MKKIVSPSFSNLSMQHHNTNGDVIIISLYVLLCGEGKGIGSLFLKKIIWLLNAKISVFNMHVKN